MPEMHVLLRWPDRSESRCYSPSVVIRDFLVAGTDYALPEFIDRARTALRIASERVRVKYGFECTRAHAQLAALEEQAARFEAQCRVAVLACEEIAPASMEMGSR